MKGIILFAVLAMFTATSCANDNKTKVTKRDNASLPQPKRIGWNSEYFPLYGNVESITMTEYKLKDSFGKVVKDSKKKH